MAKAAQQGSWLTASGSFGGRPVTLRWSSGRWSGPQPALHLFLAYLLYEGWGDGRTAEMGCPPGLMGFVPACRAAAERVFDGEVLIDYDWADLPEGAIGAPA